MNQAVTNPRIDEQMKKAIGISVAAHLVVLACLTLRAVFYDTMPEMIEDSIRVDIVALPDKSPAKLPPMAVEEAKPEAKPEPVAETKPEPKPEAKPETKPEPKTKPKPVEVAKPEAPKVNLDKRKKDQEAALKRLEAMEKLERMMKEKDSPVKPAASAGASEGKPALVKGNEVSKGTSLTGTAKLDHRTYLHSLEGHVRRFWSLPQWMANANFRARVRVYLDGRGFVIKKELTMASNNEEFDERVMRTIDEAAPFPPPPSSLVNMYSVDGVELGFPE